MARTLEGERFSQVVFYATVLLIGYLGWRIAQPFLAEIGWGIVLAICLDPVRESLQPRLGRTRSALLLTAMVLLGIVLPLVFIGTTLVSQGGPAVTYVEEQLRNQGGAAGWFHSAWGWARLHLPFLPPEQAVIDRITGSIGGLAQFLAGQATGLLASVAGLLFSLFITVAVLFFVLRDASDFAETLGHVLPFGQEHNARLMKIASDLVSASITASLAIGAIQGVIGGVTFALLGIPGPVLWGVIMTILSFVPVVGATLVWAPAAIWLALSGSFVKGIVLALVGLLIMSQVDNVVRPLLLAGKSKMNTLVLILSILGGVSAFGFIGIVLGPLVAALLTALFETYHETPVAGALDAAPVAPAELPAVSAGGSTREDGEGGPPPDAQA